MLCQCHQQHQQPQQPQVSFGDVTIRDYDRTVGDCWDLTYGLGIGWKYLEHPPRPIPEEDPIDIQHYKEKIKRMKKSKVKKSMTVMVHRLSCRIYNNKMKKEDDTIVIRSRRGSIIEQITRRKSTTNLRNIPSQYQDRPCSVATRKRLLTECGDYTSQELMISETERKRLRFEYQMWNSQHRQAHGTTKKICIPPSKLLMDRVLANSNYSPSIKVVTTTKSPTTANTTTTTTSSDMTIDPPLSRTSDDGPQSSKLLIDRVIAENKKKYILPRPLIPDSLPSSNNEQQQQQSKLLLHRRVVDKSSSNNKCPFSDSCVPYSMGISSTDNISTILSSSANNDEQQQSMTTALSSSGMITNPVRRKTAITTTSTTTTNTMEIFNDTVLSQ